ncbi:MAG: hypothetical protein HQL11_00860 [Candidatus Omnitrophica bacterium]|nr:hypothetical protein [Candidatus Omnitrophota bacterium]
MRNRYKIVLGLAVVFVACVAAMTAHAEQRGEEEVALPFRIYTDATAPDNNFAPSGWMGDSGDLQIDDADLDNPHSGGTSLRIDYSAKKSDKKGWSGIYWQYPPDNWGTREEGFDLTGAKRLVFWARGARGGEKIDKFGVGGIKGEFSDSAKVESRSVTLSDKWQRYYINLQNQDLRHIIGGFFVTFNAKSNRGGLTMYLDDIYFE